MGRHRAQPSPENAAMLGAMLGRKGLTPAEAAEVTHQAVSALDEAMRRVEQGEDVDSIQFELRSPDQS